MTRARRFIGRVIHHSPCRRHECSPAESESAVLPQAVVQAYRRRLPFGVCTRNQR
jgi:hypothetical protein